MTDVVELIRGDLSRDVQRREQMRQNFPGVASLVDEVRACFPDAKVLHATENGREVGRPQIFEGTDVDKLIRLDEMDTKRRGKR